jgi:HK97 family phage major capsid protein
VPPGYKKPVSTYSVELVQERVRVIATLSEPVDRMLLADVALMSQFIGSVLFSAVELELENQLIAGDGSTTGGLDNMTGVLHVDGTQVQEWDTDVLTTTRKAVTALEKLNLPDESGFAWAMSPDAWESFELLKDTSRFLLGDASGQPPERLPVDRSRRRLWGLPVVPTTGVTDDGIAILGDWSGSIGMWSRQAAQLEWSEAVQVPDPGSSSGATWSAFETNQRVFRAELRAGMGVLRPAAFIITDVINDGSGA